MNKVHTNTRAIAAATLAEVVIDRRSLSAVLPQYLKQCGTPQDAGLVQEICYGVLRWYFKLDALLKELLQRPLPKKDGDVTCLLLVGLYQLLYLSTPEYAAVSETVNATRDLKKERLRKLVNGVLRNFIRNKAALLEKIDRMPIAHFAHPQWMIDAIRTAWPDDWQAILEGNNQHPPMSLRVNLQQTSREDYLKQLKDSDNDATACAFTSSGILLDRPQDVNSLPGFADGMVSVQDCSAQLAPALLDLAPQQRVLDACAAPGGKTAHILEAEPRLAELIAIEKDGKRLERVAGNLERLRVNATLIQGDVTRPNAWWDGKPFDRILLDAPCSATGVIRRHPDIKLLRRPADIQKLAETQYQMLDVLWSLLKPGGILAYATCSIMPQENGLLIENFLKQHSDATEVPINESWGTPTSIGRQLLPITPEFDGFYYARLRKIS